VAQRVGDIALQTTAVFVTGYCCTDTCYFCPLDSMGTISSGFDGFSLLSLREPKLPSNWWPGGVQAGTRTIMHRV